MTQPNSHHFERAEREKEAELEQMLENEQQIRADQEEEERRKVQSEIDAVELENINEKLEASRKKGKEFLTEHDLTEEEVMKGKRFFDNEQRGLK